MTDPVIIANGGAGGIGFAERRERGLVKAVRLGYEILRGGGSSLDAVTKSVMCLEDIPIFNAGRGSVMGLTGEIEMDASVMTSAMQYGAVAAIRNVRHPIRVARLVMEKTDHLLLCGAGAVRFARLMGIKFYDPVTRERRAAWQRAHARLDRIMKKSGAAALPASDYFPRLSEIAGFYGTVGVVALDKEDRIAVGTSTGGIKMHLPGRVGDTPQVGAGTYADRHGGASATGHGESIMLNLIAFRAVNWMSRGSAEAAGTKVIGHATRQGCRCGVIGIDRRGGILCTHNTGGMSWAYIKAGTLATFRRQ